MAVGTYTIYIYGYGVWPLFPTIFGLTIHTKIIYDWVKYQKN